MPGWKSYTTPPPEWTNAMVDALNDPSDENVDAFIKADLSRIDEIQGDFLTSMFTLYMCSGFMAEMAQTMTKEQRPRGAKAWHIRARRFLRNHGFDEWRKEELANPA